MSGADACVTRGEAQAGAGDLAAAAESFRQALEQDPSSVPALLWMSRLALLGDAGEQGLVLIERLLAVAPGHPEGLALRGVAALAAGDAASAAEWSLEARAADPSLPVAWALAAKAHLELGDRGAAVAAGRRALELSPRDVETRITLAQVAAEEGRAEEAVDQLVAALETEPRCLPVYLVLGEIFGALERPDLVQALYAEGLRHLPDAAPLQRRLATLPPR